MVRLLILSAVVTFSGCQCSHLIGESDIDAGPLPGCDAGPVATNCTARPWDAGAIVCPYGDAVALDNQPCDRAGQTCRSSTCTANTCSSGCVEGTCEPTTCAWKAATPVGPNCVQDGGSCKYAVDCPATIGTTCFFSTASAFPSCVQNRCIEECPAPRTCSLVPVDGGSCLKCIGQLADCPAQCDQVSPPMNVTIRDVQCTPGFDAGVLTQALSWQSTSPASCRYDLAPLGSMTHLASGNSVADFPALGGICVGRNLVTGLLRTQWSCPACSFVMEGWD